MIIKHIPGYEDMYGVDASGKVWSFRGSNPIVLKPYTNIGGHLRVNLCKSGKVEHRYVHRLVAAAFIENPNGYDIVNHLNADPADNRVENLEWCDQGQNIRYSRMLGNQNDIPITAKHIITGEKRNYKNLKDAGEDIFGKWWALRYLARKHKDGFHKGPWLFEVMEQ